MVRLSRGVYILGSVGILSPLGHQSRRVATLDLSRKVELAKSDNVFANLFADFLSWMSNRTIFY